MFDLKSFRVDKLKISQLRLAELLDMKQDTLSRLEQSGEQISLEVLRKIAKITGATLDELADYTRPTPKAMAVIDTWRYADFIKHSIVEYIGKQLKLETEWEKKYKDRISELNDGVKKIITKPKIAFVGNSDVGKSRIINAIIGSEKMPATWTPTTSIVVYIKHLNDRPDFIHDEVWIFRASIGNETGWDPKSLAKQEYCEKWKLSSGSSDKLKDYGTRQGEVFEKNEAGAAVIFVDSEILKNCDIIDLPGFGTGDRSEDDEMTLKAKDYADVLIYMSHAAQFMQGGGIEYLKETINALNVPENKKKNSLKPLANLFIVASHAHTIDGGNSASLDTILTKGCERLERTMPDGFWDNRSSISEYDYNPDVIRSRFFTYTTDIESVREQFEKELKELVEILPQIICEQAKVFIKDYISATGITVDKEIEEYSAIIKQRNEYALALEEIEKTESKRSFDNQNRRLDLVADIKKMSFASVAKFTGVYGKIMSAEYIEEVIKTKGFKKKKEDAQLLVGYINSMLQIELQKILKEESEKLKEKVDKYVVDFQGSIKLEKFSISNTALSFDVTNAFGSGLVGLATLGGLAIWASTLGNLGAYILIAKGVSLLSMVGISVGGTAAAAATVSAMGGPIVLGIALAVIGALTFFAFVSGGWEKSLAKKIVKEYESNNVLGKYRRSIELFWSETDAAFNAAAKSLDDQWQKYVENLKEMVSSYDVHDIETRIRTAQDFKNFLAGIPL